MSKDVEEESTGPPRVFISYTHENPDHKRWVAQLATDLRSHGVDAILDQWELQLGDDVTLFMEQGIRNSDRVLLVCTPTYARKANEGQGGVGYERLVVTGELADKIDTNKFVCVLRLGTKSEAIPTFAQPRLYIDFTDESGYELSLEEVLRDIHQSPISPKPPVGVNPFKGSEQPVIEPTRLSGRKPSTEASADIEELYSRATQLLRDRDLLGWKVLVRNVRRAVPLDLIDWRQAAQQAIRDGQGEKEQWFEMVHRGCRAAAPLMLLAMSAVDAEIEEISDQRGVLDDLLNVSGWQRGGTTIVIEAPGAIAYVYHNILGAFLVSSNRHDEAIRLLRTRVPISVGSSHVGELWQSSELMGWSESLGHKLTDGWRFLHSVWEEHPWLAHFYVSREELYVGVRVYVLLAGFLELARYLGSGGDIAQLDNPQGSYSSVPPVFLTPIANYGDTPSTDKLVSMAVPDKHVLDRISDEFGCSIAQIRQAWPHFYNRWLRESGHLFGHRLAIIAGNQEHPPQIP